MEDPRYPIGRFQPPSQLTAEDRRRHLDQLDQAPANLREAVRGLGSEQLESPYREGGWTVRQVVHHVADSHLNGFVRFRLALTEEEPTIKPYAPDRWAELSDSRTGELGLSLTLLDSLHQRWVMMLRSLGEGDWARGSHHPELGLEPLEVSLAKYAWHGRHHTAHITRLRESKGWL